MKKRALLFLLCLSLLAGTLLSCADTHVHTYADTWSSSESAHWKADTCGHDTKTEEAPHTFGTDFVCTVCGYAMTGDTLSVKIIKVAKSYFVARIEQILSPSPYRAKEQCYQFR